MTIRQHATRPGWTVLTAYNYLGEIIREDTIRRHVASLREIQEMYDWLRRNNRPSLQLVS